MFSVPCSFDDMALKKPLRRSAIHGVNICLLVVVLIGLPAVASLRLGGMAISSVETRHQLVFWSALLAAAGNVAAFRFIAHDAQERRRCRDWALLFLALSGAEWLYHRGDLSFGWLKNWLLRFRR